jgi:formiminoglutamase
VSALYDDRDWPRARAWLSGTTGTPHPQLRVLGLPVTRGSITPSRCDLAPAAIRESLQRFSTFDVLHERDLRDLPVADMGDLPLAQATPEEAHGPIMQAVREALAQTTALALLGGDNALTYPACAGTETRLQDCGLITIDAHLDLRHLDNGLSNGNPLRALLRDGLPGRNIVQIGIQSFANSREYFRVARDAGITVIPVERVAEEGIEAVTRRALAEIGTRVRSIYIDLDLDVQDRDFAPACAGARPGGLTPLDIRRAAYLCGLHPQVRVLDLVEIDPERDINGVTALSAAACLLAFASGVLGRVQAGGGANAARA